MTKTSNLNLNVPDYRDLRWDIPVNENWNLIDAAVAGKQATLTFDNTPTSGSSNPVTSDGIYNAIVSVTVDQVYNATSANAQSGIAINGARFLNNTASGMNSLSILGSVIAAGSATAVGVDSDAGANGVSLGKSASSGNGGLALGTYAKANGSWATAVGNGNSNLNNTVASGSGSIAVGHNAQATASNAIQIGEGTNSTADSLQVKNYSLLNTSTGIIPYQRINAVIDDNLGGQLKIWTGTRSQYESLGTSYYAWYFSNYGGETVYTLSATPSVGDHYFIYYDGIMHDMGDPAIGAQGDVGLVTTVGTSDIGINGEDAYRYVRDSSKDKTIASGGLIDSNTLYNITDTGEIYLGSTIISNYGADTSLSNLSASGQAALNTFVINILKEIYPIGSIYIGTTPTCPLATLFGTWTSVSSGRVLQGADSGHNAGTTIEAGLPNITGSFAISSAQGFRNEAGVFSGAFKNGDALSYSSGGEAVAGCKADFDASLSSSIYGNSSTVQPPAYVVNIWQRTA